MYTLCICTLGGFPVKFPCFLCRQRKIAINLVFMYTLSTCTLGELPKKKNSEMGRDAKNTAEEQGKY